MLDTNGQNVPFIGRKGREWGRKHYRVRAACRDFLLVADRLGLHAFFLTLTSSAASDRGRLRVNFQVFRKRLARRLGLPPSEVRYCGVDTEEGHGVLHLLIAVPPGRGRSARFLVSVEWVRGVWEEVHGARQFRVVPVRRGEASARRLSRYIVSQYVAGQDALVRLSRSRFGGASAALRRAFLRLVMTDSARYWLPLGHIADLDERVRTARAVWWRTFRVGWESLVRRGQAWVFGRWVVLTLTGELEYV